MNQGAKNTLKYLASAVIGMFFFSFALVPLYNVFCEITGLNGKIELSPTKFVQEEPIQGRALKVQFVSHNNEQMPWSFSPSAEVINITTGKYYKATYFVKNNTDKVMVGQAIPSVAPSNAAAHLKKLECFCFEQQRLLPGEEAYLPVKLLFDNELPESINNVVLSYTIFDVTDTYEDEIVQNTHSMNTKS